MTSTTVIKITPASKLPNIPGRMIFVCGIDTEYRAKCWGERNNHRTVWWWQSRRRAYAIDQVPGGLAS